MMRPVSFDGCFGWWHPATAGAGGDIAVVLCPGLRRDASNAHRPFRILADQLAAAGLPALRFDYAGTGDACDEQTGDYWRAWQRNIMQAADLALELAGARRILLIGLRFGAALAALTASRRDDLAGLVLIDPVLRGKSMMTQFVMEARLRNKGLADQQDGLRLDELCLSGETVQRISGLDLREVTPPACPVVVYSQDQPASLQAFTSIWAGKGASVTSEGFAGLETLLCPAHLAETVVPDFASMVSRLSGELSRPPTEAFKGTPAMLPTVRRAMLRSAGWVETPFAFGERGRLFGILCRPDEVGGSDVAVVLGNPGGDPHHGYARFSVELARSLAARGIASLRIDFAGLGDSVLLSEEGAEAATSIFELDRCPDFSAAFDALEPLGYRRFAVHGLCSGAYHAFHAGLADPRVVALLLINLPWFSLRHERASPESFARRSMAELGRRQVARLLLFAAGDPGLRPLEQHFGRGGADLCGPAGVEVSISPDLDHDLTGHAMRRDAAERMVGFLQRVLPARDEPTAVSRSASVHSIVVPRPDAAALGDALITSGD